MNNKKFIYIILVLYFVVNISANAQEWFKEPKQKILTRWVSPENPTGEKGEGGKINKGAKGNAFFIIAPGETRKIFDVKGAGTIRRIWLAGSISRNIDHKRTVRIDMYWDGSEKPAVSAPVGDFFGHGLSVNGVYESSLFASPEGKSYVCNVPMPYRTSALIELTNESPTYILLWYDINYLVLPEQDEDAMYFHAYWNREISTKIGKDYTVLPTLKGKGRFLGANFGVIGNPIYNGTWFGEGEVKMYLDGDKEWPTLIQTGTEDYIGTGGGQGEFSQLSSGSVVADYKNDLYTFYRYHTVDPVYFYEDIRVTLQQLGSASIEKTFELLEKIPDLNIVWRLESWSSEDIRRAKGKEPVHVNYLDMDTKFEEKYPGFTNNGFANFYRSDDVSSTAYFYLTEPENNLPPLPSLEIRTKYLEEKVFSTREWK